MGTAMYMYATTRIRLFQVQTSHGHSAIANDLTRTTNTVLTPQYKLVKVRINATAGVLVQHVLVAAVFHFCNNDVAQCVVPWVRAQANEQILLHCIQSGVSIRSMQCLYW